MNESDTRLKKIDPRLREAGWGVVEGSDILTEQRAYLIAPGRIKRLGTRNPKKIDYLLMYRGLKMAIVEAKSDEKDVSEGVRQAKEYADMMQMRYTYATNGDKIWAIDMERGKEEEVDSFPTPDEMWQRLFPLQNEWRDRFNAEPFHIGRYAPRYYQELAVNRVLEAISLGQKRMLLTLATGTGKTYIAFQIAWRLVQTHWPTGNVRREPRILFLTDRNFLADQASNDFSGFPTDAMCRISPENLRKDGLSKSRNIYFTIFNTLMTQQTYGKPLYREFPSTFFDLIIIDECHRGGANDESQWREIMEYFSPAYQLGLTATPKKTENANTYKYFGAPLYAYSLKQGIEDGYLTPYRVKRCHTMLDEYYYNSDDEILEGEEFLVRERVYDEDDFYRGDIVMRERDELRVIEMLQKIKPHEKTVVFCATQKHAAVVRDMINQHAQSHDPFYCVRVTADDNADGERYLKLFSEVDKQIPTILITSRKLSTGMDAKNVRNIVLMRPVNNIIEFKQIVGRGTRIFDDKYFFTIIDFAGAAKNFEDPEWDGYPEVDEEDNQPDDDQPRTPREHEPCPQCGQWPCVCPKEPCPVCGCDPCICPHESHTVRIKLSADRFIEAQASARWQEMFYFEGRPMTMEDFMRYLFNRLPTVFGSIDNLKQRWSNPETRQQLLNELDGLGISPDHLLELQKLLQIDDCDLLDMLEYIAYDIEPIKRKLRVEMRKERIFKVIPGNQREFIGFVLAQYITGGVKELGNSNLPELLKLKYNDSLNDGLRSMNTTVKELRASYLAMQSHLYLDKAIVGDIHIDKNYGSIYTA